MQILRVAQALTVVGLVAFTGCKKDPPLGNFNDSTATSGTPMAKTMAAPSRGDSTATDTTPAAMAKKTTPPKKP